MNRFLRRLTRANRFALAITMGFCASVVTLVAIGLWKPTEVFGPGALMSFYQSLLTTVFFFGLVGAAGVAQQLYSARGDILRKRVEYVFATTGVSAPLVEYVERIIKKNALYSTGTEHRVQVLEYRPDLQCYRVSMETTYQLLNVFGDLEQSEVISFNFVPDVVNQPVTPLAELVALTITRSGVVTEQAERQVIPADGLHLEVQLRAGPREVVAVRVAHWTWASNSESSGFSIRRFSERTRVVLENRSGVTVRVFLEEKPEDVYQLRYADERCLRDEDSVPEMRRLGFSWLPPVEYPTAAPKSRLELHPLLREADQP